jgi:hypothetical protein
VIGKIETTLVARFGKNSGHVAKKLWQTATIEVNQITVQGSVWIHQLNFSWLNLAVRNPNDPNKRPAKV